MTDIIRIACCVPKVSACSVEENIENIKKLYADAAKKGADVALFPECSITGYTCGDLFLQSSLLSASAAGLLALADYTEHYDTCMAVGLPFVVDDMLFDCAAFIYKGKICGIVPKIHVSHEESRWFVSGAALKRNYVKIGDLDVPFGTDLLFDICGTKLALEVGCDMYAPNSPSVRYAENGAHAILNLSAHSEIIGDREIRRCLLRGTSFRLSCVYACAFAGKGESTTDYIYSGHSMILESGNIIAENTGFVEDDYIITADVDTQKIRIDKMRNNREGISGQLRIAELEKKALSGDIRNTVFSKNPFIPCEAERESICRNVFDIQVEALIKRLNAAGGKAVVGVSGGLDSTLALLVCSEAARRMGESPENVIGITMPCFGTTDRTYTNSLRLMKALGIKMREISIKEACILHMKDIGHPIDLHDVTYENTQARERTQVLMDAANQEGAVVVGTGDLSELALGWCTYNADHMSMYGVNSGVPKTLIREVIKSTIEAGMFKDAREVLEDILDTPISPELLPPDTEGKIAQKTEDLVGPYELHDFFLYYVLRYGFSPKKIYEMAKTAFGDGYPDETILKWLKTFYRRFFTQQFKRSCLPDGVKVFSIGISPRGDLKMPSDAACSLWMKEIEEI